MHSKLGYDVLGVLAAGLLLLLATVAVLVGIGLHLLRRMVIVLEYHGVGREPSAIPGLVIRPEAFRRQLRLLQWLGYTARPVDRLFERLDREGRVTGPVLSITFDDGYRNIKEHALPLLREKGWGATVFIPLYYVGSQNRWDHWQQFPNLELLAWEELLELQGPNLTIGAHGHRHVSLPSLSEEECRREIAHALGQLQSRLKTERPLFSYPYGHRSERVSLLVEQAGFYGACSLVAGGHPRKADRFDLGRFVVRHESVFLLAAGLVIYQFRSFLRTLLRSHGNASR